MRIAIFGAGAIGGYVAAKLAAAGRVDLSIVARGEHLDAIEARGLRLIEDGKESAHPVRAAAQSKELGVQDYVVLTLKAHSVGPALDQIAPLIGENTAVVTMQNGVPWWYFHKIGGPLEGTRVEAVDPAADLERARTRARDRLGGLSRRRGRCAGPDPPRRAASAFRWASRPARRASASRGLPRS